MAGRTKRPRRKRTTANDRPSGAEYRAARHAREGTWHGVGHLLLLVNHAAWVGPDGEAFVADGEPTREGYSSALADVLRYATRVLTAVAKDGEAADVTSIGCDLQPNADTEKAFAAAVDAREWVQKIALHLQQGQRWKRLRQCECGCGSWLFAQHARTKFLPRHQPSAQPVEGPRLRWRAEKTKTPR